MRPSTTSSPTLRLTLTPRLPGYPSAGQAGIEVSYRLSAPDSAAGQPLFRLPIVIAGIPGAPLDATSFTVTDDAGALALQQEDAAPTAMAAYRRWTGVRATVGDLAVRYVAPVRLVDTSTTNGPFYDLRAEAGGVCGAGVTFLALPDTTDVYDIALAWDLALAPAGARGVCSWGEGPAHLTGTMDDLAYTYYMAGPLHSYPDHPDAGGDAPSVFSMYWLSEPSFDPVAVAAVTERLYATMCAFFQEPAPGFRVFVRKHPYQGNGGTAARRSFMFGYSEETMPTIASLTTLLAHELAHNWPMLDGDWDQNGWFDEGAAEYYSIALLRRGGFITDDDYLALINERARNYYTNPLQTLNLREATELYWRDPRAQRIPYGRGLFYFIDLNAKLVSATSGARSLDDLILAVVQRRRAGETIHAAEWLALVASELGEQGQRDYEAMAEGAWIVPASDALGPRYLRREIEDAPLDLGFATSSYTSRVVTGLVAGSPAERAGVRGGDRILSIPNFSVMEQAPWAAIDLTLARGDSTLRVRYVPQGARVRSYEWIRAPRPERLATEATARTARASVHARTMSDASAISPRPGG